MRILVKEHLEEVNMVFNECVKVGDDARMGSLTLAKVSLVEHDALNAILGKKSRNRTVL